MKIFPLKFWLSLQQIFNNNYTFIKYSKYYHNQPVLNKSGLPQGDGRSTTLFNVYTSDLINLIQNAGELLEIYNIKLAILAWPDDNIMFAKNLSTFDKILCICDNHQYSTQQHLNAIKCRIVELNKQNNKQTKNQTKFTINETENPKTEIIKYL